MSSKTTKESSDAIATVIAAASANVKKKVMARVVARSAGITATPVVAAIAPSSSSRCLISTSTSSNPQSNTKRAEVEANMRVFLQNHKANEGTKTHTVFNGSILGVTGPFSIQDADRERFYKLYTKCHRAGTRLNFVEQKPSKKWPFFLDCDGKPEDTPNILKNIDAYKKSLMEEIIPSTLKLAFGIAHAAPTLEIHCKTNNPNRFHVFIGDGANIVLTSESASAVRSHLIQTSLEWSKKLPEPFPEKEVAKFIDAVMESNTGLRMYGSLKLDPNDTDYVQPHQPVSVATLHKYSIQPIDIASKAPTELTVKMQKWWKAQRAEAAIAAKAQRKTKAQTTRQTLVAKANTRADKTADNRIMACAAKHELTIQIDAEGRHAISPNTSQCPICQRMHENERAFLFLDDYGIKCFCFRAHREHHGEPGKNNGNPNIDYVMLLEQFERHLPTLEGLIHHGAMYWAHFLVDSVGLDIRVCGDKVPSYFVFQASDGLWSERDGASLVRRAVYDELLPKLQTLCDELHTNNAFADDPALEKEFKRSVWRCTDVAFLDQIATGFKSFAQCTTEHPAKVFNQHKELLSIENGVIDMKALQLRPRTRDDLFTIKVPCVITQAQLDRSRARANASEAASPETIEAVKRTFLPNRDDHPLDAPEYFDQMFYGDVWELETDRVPFIQRSMGVCLTGYTNASRVLMLYGKGSNCKSVFNKLLLNQGEFHKSISYDALCVQSSANHDELYQAQYARVLTFNESDPDKPFDWTQLLKLSGGDELNPAAKFKTNRAYVPQFNVIGFCNDLPKFPPKIGFAKQRRVVPFKMRKIYLRHGDPVDDIERKRLVAEGTPELIGAKDTALDQKLDMRRIGWLLWQLEGAYFYCQHQTIPIPPSLASDLTDRYDAKQITPEKFLESCYSVQETAIADNGAWVSVNQLHQEYVNYDGNGHTNKSIALNSFSRKIQDFMAHRGTDAIMQRAAVTAQGRQCKVTMICNLRPIGLAVPEGPEGWQGGS